MSLRCICISISTLLVALADDPSVAQTKRDIRGFTPGMSLEQALQVQCAVNKPCCPRVGGSVIYCDTEGMEPFPADKPIQLIITFAFNFPTVAEVRYAFKSSASSTDVVTAITKQFAIEPSCLACAPGPYEGDHPHAKWNLNDQLVLVLETQFVGSPKVSPNVFVVHLYSQKIIDAERQIKENAIKGINPHPKF